MTFLLSSSLIKASIEPIECLHLAVQLPSDEQTHDIRVSIKRTLARLKLIRALTGNSADLAAFVTQLKKLKEYLSEQRDNEVQLALIENLLGQNYPDKVNLLLVHTREFIIKTTYRQNLECIKAITTGICSEMANLANIQLPLDNLLIYVTKKQVKLAGSCLKILHTRQPKKLHKLRRRVKCLYYQCRDLVDGDASIVLPVDGLYGLGKILGQVQDLSVLERLLNQQQLSGHVVDEQGLNEPYAYHMLFEIIANKRHRLVSQCQALHQQLF